MSWSGRLCASLMPLRWIDSAERSFFDICTRSLDTEVVEIGGLGAVALNGGAIVYHWGGGTVYQGGGRELSPRYEKRSTLPELAPDWVRLRVIA